MKGRAPHRPAEFKGVRTRDLRIKFYLGKHSRGFYARRRPQLRRWECQLSGFNMTTRRWFSVSQTMALAELRMIPSMWRWTPAGRSDHLQPWDGITDAGFVTQSGAVQLSLDFPPVAANGCDGSASEAGAKTGRLAAFAAASGADLNVAAQPQLARASVAMSPPVGSSASHVQQTSAVVMSQGRAGAGLSGSAVTPGQSPIYETGSISDANRSHLCEVC